MAFEQREAWRREAELACVKSGAVKSGTNAVAIRAIDGPGMCGADYPFKVAALGDRTILGYVQDMRPPSAVPQGFPVSEPRRSAPVQSRPYDDASFAPPMSIQPPGAEVIDDDEAEADTAEVSPPPQSAPPPALGLGRGQGIAVSAAAVAPQATLACPLVSRLDQWMANAVQPAAQRWFGQQVSEIRQISAYSCRGMNGNPRARISEHAFGNALDIAAFTLADGRRVTVKNGWHGAPEEQGFLRDVHAAACQHFSTVLAPGSNRFHYDHIHVDLARRRSGRSYCNPKPIPGDLIARRASDRFVTGSVNGGRLGFAPEERAPARDAKLPRAIAGED